MSKPNENLGSPAEGAGGDESQQPGVSLDVLCRRAERLIDSVRMLGEQADRMFARPERFLAEANDTARSLAELRDRTEERISEARQAEQACGARMEALGRLLPTIKQSAEDLIQRVTRAQQLSDAFGRLMDSAGERISAMQSAADETRKTRQAIGGAIRELGRTHKAAENWTQSANQLSSRQAEFITAENAAASRWRTLSDAGERLRESVRQDVVTLRELLRESRVERMAWEQLLARTPGALSPAAACPVEASSVADAKSVPASLAERVRRLTDLIRQTAHGDSTAAPSATPVRPASPRSGTAEASGPETSLLDGIPADSSS